MPPRSASAAALAASALLALLLGAPSASAAGRAEGKEAPPPPAEAEGKEARRLAEADLRRLEKVLAARPDSLEARLDRLRLLYVLAVKEEERMAEGDREVAALASFAGRGADPVLLQAYRGAFRVLGAKHAGWPPRKMDHLKAGLPALDSAVAARPDHAEVRYLRLVSCYYLPFFIGRKAGVREDFAALGRLLPAAHKDYPARWWLGFTRFVLDKGDLPDAERAALEARRREVAEAAARVPAGAAGTEAGRPGSAASAGTAGADGEAP